MSVSLSAHPEHMVQGGLEIRNFYAGRQQAHEWGEKRA